MRDTIDITPEQYHAGLDLLWDRLGITSFQNRSVFELAAEALKQRAELLALVKAVKCDGWSPIVCEDVNGVNWFDAAEAAIAKG